VSALAPQTPQAPQTPSLAQQDQCGFIRSLLVKAQAKIQFNKQKKLEKIIQLAQKKQTITNSVEKRSPPASLINRSSRQAHICMADAPLGYDQQWREAREPFGYVRRRAIIICRSGSGPL